VDIGGASTQIAFFVPNQDILANMFKLQLGAQKHWNVYVHSFLYFGVNSARDRFHTLIIGEAMQAGKKRATNPCYPSGYSENYVGEDGKTYVIEGSTPNIPSMDAYVEVATLLLRKVS